MSIDEKMLLQDKILGILIRDARQVAGKTQKECAAFLDMSAGMLSDIEYGERPMSLPELEALAYLLDVPVEHFLGGQLLETVEKKPFPVKELLILRSRVIGVLLRQARMAANRGNSFSPGEARRKPRRWAGTPGVRPEVQFLLKSNCLLAVSRPSGFFTNFPWHSAHRSNRSCW